MSGLVGTSVSTPAMCAPCSANSRSSAARSFTLTNATWLPGPAVNFFRIAMVSRYNQPSCTHTVRPRAACCAATARNAEYTAFMPLAVRKKSSSRASGNAEPRHRRISAAASPFHSVSASTAGSTPRRTRQSSAARAERKPPVCWRNALAFTARSENSGVTTPCRPSSEKRAAADDAKWR